MPDKPNILWITADQHNAKVTSWGDFPEPVHTPNLDRLADHGVRFDNAFAQNPLCTPSRVSLLTGKYPMNHGYFGLPQFTTHSTPDSTPPTVFEVFDELGYRTAAIGKTHLPDGFEKGIGYERNVLERAYESHHNGPYEEYLYNKGVLDDRDDQLLQEGGFDGRPSRLDYEDISEYWSVEQSKLFIKEDEIAYPGVNEYIRNSPGYEMQTDKPFFLWLSFLRPHNPYTPPDEFWEMYPEEDDLTLPPSADEDLSDKPATQQQVRKLQEEGEMFAPAVEPKSYEAQRRRCVKGYLGCVSMIDDCVGRILDFLESEGLRENTIVIYSSDHGEFISEHGLLEKAPGVGYDAVSRVPFIWSWPKKFQSGVVRSELVELIDLFPTLVSLAAGKDVDSTDGADLSGLLTGENLDSVRQYAITETPWVKSIRTEDRRLTVYPEDFFGEGEQRYFEAYDYNSDPWEMENLGGSGVPESFIQVYEELYDHLVTKSRPITAMPTDPGRNYQSLDLSDAGEEVADGTIPPKLIRDFLREHGGSLHL